jgi:hypothetical protein
MSDLYVTTDGGDGFVRHWQLHYGDTFIADTSAPYIAAVFDEVADEWTRLRAEVERLKADNAIAYGHDWCGAASELKRERALADQLAEALRKTDRQLRFAIGAPTPKNCNCFTCAALAAWEAARHE